MSGSRVPVLLTVLAGVASACSPDKPAADIPPPTTARTDSAPAPQTEEQALLGEAAGKPPVAQPVVSTSSGGAFALRLFAKTTKAPGNKMVSPASARLALAIPYLGAKGATASEMASVLGLGADAAGDAKKELADWNEAKGKCELTIASRLYVAKDHAPAAAFTKQVDDVLSLDFAKPDDARKTINGWAAEKTHDKIPELLAKGTVDAKTSVVVANAVYFKGRWSLPFPAGATKNDAFHLDGGKSIDVPTMHATDSFRYAELNGVKLVELRYDGSDLAMDLALPDDPKLASAFPADADESMMEKAFAQLGARRVSISLPKFTYRSGGSLNEALEDLGMKTAFTDAADFSGVSPGLALSQVVQQDYVAVDEQGTEAAAATGVVMRPTSLMLGPVVDLKFDRPFLFAIRDTKRGRILFLGRVADPSSKGS
jgi:serpin B